MTDALEEVEASVKDAGGEVLSIAADVSSPEQIEAAIQQIIGRSRPLDIAFNKPWRGEQGGSRPRDRSFGQPYDAYCQEWVGKEQRRQRCTIRDESGKLVGIA